MFRVASLVVGFAAAVSLAEDTNTSSPAGATSGIEPSGPTSNIAPSTITIDGVTYEGVRWGRLTPGTVTIYHKTGIATMPLADLPPELQKQFGYDPQKAATWLASEQAATAARQAAEWEAVKRRAAEQRAAQLKAAADAEAERQRALAAAAHPTVTQVTNQMPQNVNQPANRSVGGVTVNDILKRIQRNYGTPPP
jgi:hypothetical protein